MTLNAATSQIFNKANLKLGLPLISTVILAGCGGGNSSSSSSSSTPTLNLNAAYTSYIKGGSQVTGAISGYCQGTRVLTYSATYLGTTLSNIPALISNNNETDTLAANSSQFCQSFYSSNNGGNTYQIYYDPTNVTPITSGATKNGFPLGYVYSNQVAPPTSVTAGATGTLATYLNYDGEPIPLTSGAITWAVTADTATTLLWTTTDTAKVYGTELLIYKSITTYRINANSTLTDLYKNIQATTIATQGQGDQNIYEVYQ
jgi:hypothetical protein